MTTEASLQSMATVLHRDATTGLRFVRTFRHPPERGWRAITESEHLAQWFACDIVGDRVPGAPLRFAFWPDVVEKFAIDVPTPQDVASGYHTCLGHLIDVVDHGGSVSVAQSDPAPLTAHYEANWDALDHVDVAVDSDLHVDELPKESKS
jgi:hypothetical protein